ncbi:MAG: T9SS type A sorting domain-containing protein [Bacteroidia bacterium]
MKRFLLFSILLTALMILLPAGKLLASHTIGGEITYKCLGNNQYEFNMVFYRDCTATFATMSPTITISSASCGQSINSNGGGITLIGIDTSIVTPVNNSPSCTGGAITVCLQQYQYRATVTLPACPDWEIVAGLTCCRNQVLNIAGGQGVIAFLDNSAAAAGPNAFCNSTPIFYGASANVLCVNNDYILDPGVFEVDGDSLSFSLAEPRDGTGNTIGYSNGFTLANPLPSNPGMNVNPLTGEVTIRPTAQGNYGFAVEIEEWRAGQLVGRSSREFQVLVVPCPTVNNAPDILVPLNLTGGIQFGSRIDVCPGAVLSFDIPAVDADANDTVFVRDSIGVAWGTITVNRQRGDSATATFNGTAPMTPGNFQLVMYARDNGCPIFASNTYSININVKDGTTILGNAIRFSCSNGSNPATLIAVGGNTFNWTVVSGDATSLNGLNTTRQTISVNPASSTIYTVATNFLCASGAPSVTVNVVNPPSTVITGAVANPNTLCGIQTLPISVTPSGGSGGPFTYSWFPSITVANPTDSATMVTPTDTTDYVISVFDPASGCTATDVVRVNVSAPYLQMAPTISANTYCPGDTPIDLESNATAGNCASYKVSSTAYNRIPIVPTGPDVIPLGIATTSNAIPLGFDFDFYCNTVDTFWVSSGGWMSFTDPAGVPYTGAQTIPAAANPNNLIAFAWGDYTMSPFSGSFLTYNLTGTAPNRIGVLDLAGGVSVSNSSNQNTIQVKLFEATGDIEIHVTRSDAGSPITIGVEDPTGNLGATAPGRNNATVTIGAGQEEAWKFNFDRGAPWRVDWYEQPLPGTLVGTGDVVQITPSSPSTYCAIITDIASNCNFTTCLPTIVDAASLNVNASPAGPYLIGQTCDLTSAITGPVAFSCNGYQVPKIPYNPSALTAGATTLTMGDDDTQGPFNLGFSLDWYCNPVTQVWINSNGWLAFSNPNNTTPGPFNIPDLFAPDDMVSFVGSDLEPNAGGTIRYEAVGTAPNRQFIVDFVDVPFYASSNLVTVQVVINETTGLIDIHSNRIDADPAGNITQGVQLNSTTGTAVPGRNNVSLASAIRGDGVRFRPDTSNISCTWTSDAGPGMLQDSTACDAVSVPLSAANSLVCFFLAVDNGSCILNDTVCVQVGALPVGEFEFGANVVNRQVRLDWLMPEGDSYDRFIVENATQGGRFVPVGEVKAGNESTFSFLHEDPEEGLNRYRLHIIDAGGNYINSNVVEAYIGTLEEHLVSVFPNPSNGEFTLSYHLPEPAKVEIQVTDIQGRVIYERNAIHTEKGSYNELLDLQKFDSGVYLYQLRINGKRVAGKIQVQR